MSKADFGVDREFGIKWEDEVSDSLKDQLRSVMVSNISFDEDPETQLDGIDSILQQDEATFDIKTERPKYRNSPNLPIETWSVVDRAEKGWFHTSKSDYIIWLRPNKAETNIHSAFLMVLDDDLEAWFKERRESYRRVKVPNEGYTTIIRLVPINDFPEDKLYKFDLTLSDPVEDEQQELSDWVGGDDD